MKTQKQIELTKLWDEYNNARIANLDNLCQLAVKLADGYDNNGNTHGDNMIMKRYLHSVMNDIGNILDSIDQGVGIHSPEYEAFWKLKDRIYDTYFENIQGFKVTPGHRY